MFNSAIVVSLLLSAVSNFVFQMSSSYLVNKSVRFKHLLDTSESDLYTSLPVYAGLDVESSHRSFFYDQFYTF